MTRRRKLALGVTPVAVIIGLGAGQAALHAKSLAQSVQAPAFDVEILWPKPLPNRWILGSAVGVAVDSHDHIFVLNLTDSFNQRTEIGAATSPPTGECCTPAPAVLEFDQAGTLVAHWGGPGQGYTWPATPSGIAVDGKDNVWIGGSGASDGHVLKFSHDGKFLAQMGKPGAAPAPAAAPAAGGGGGRGAGRGAGGDSTAGRGRGAGRGAGAAGAGDSAGGAARGRGGRGRGGGGGGAPTAAGNSNSMEDFGGATRIAFDAAANEAYVADGARNHRVAVIDMNTGAIKRIWGAFGNKPDDAPLPAYTPGGTPAQQFGTPVRCALPSTDGMVYVCDPKNDRIQVFRKNGTFVKEKLIAPQTRGEGSVWDVAFSRDPQQKYLYVADGANMKVHVLDRESLNLLTSFGEGGRHPGEFFGVHSVTTDSKGNLYTTETYEGKRVQRFVYRGIRSVPQNQGVLWPGRR